ncbi:MAG: hypothetical protein RBT63_05730 [Bdellovibrionales bacterium]|jgi:hypothetical protein|nr:hypothetical protein [Bdellovibrionales bacterium]
MNKFEMPRFIARSHSRSSRAHSFLATLTATVGISAFVLLATSSQAFAWGRIGHDLAARVAAHLVAETTNKSFYKSRAYDLGYYCNVPDLVWKKPATYEAEYTNHFMNLEVFDREFKKAIEEGRLSPKEDPYELSRQAFETRFPSLPRTTGRAWWRVRELEKRLAATADLLKQRDILLEERHRLQGEWLLVAGVIGHYITDLAQPFHVTEDYDGEAAGQKGIHGHFEDKLVDQLWPSIDMQVYKEADRMWEKERAAMAGKSTLALMKELSTSSNKEIEEILKRDKRTSRDDLKKAVEVYRPILVKRLAAGAVVLAEIWRRHTNWAPNEERFFVFNGQPEFIAPPEPPAPKPSPTPAKKK